jgi:hypothetical protein
MGASYRPQTDGQTERLNQEVKKYLRNYTHSHKPDWDEFLGLCEFALNSRYNRSIGMTPFQADIGYNPRLPVDVDLPTETTVKTFITSQLENLKKIQHTLQEAKDKMKFFYDKGRRDQSFKVNDLVLISLQNLSHEYSGHDSKTLGPR